MDEIALQINHFVSVYTFPLKLPFSSVYLNVLRYGVKSTVGLHCVFMITLSVQDRSTSLIILPWLQDQSNTKCGNRALESTSFLISTLCMERVLHYSGIFLTIFNISWINLFRWIQPHCSCCDKWSRSTGSSPTSEAVTLTMSTAPITGNSSFLGTEPSS